MLNLFKNQLASAVHLSDEQVAAAVAQLVDESVPAEIKADFLCELARKIETPGEIAAFARELRAKSIAPPLDSETRARVILDVCGTGGDRLNTFNISTTVAFICAAAGITVAKHGNRAVTSQAGSADVLEALGVPVELSPEQAAQSLREHHFAFFFAPKFHPTFRHIAAARKLCAARGQRTIFNFLGPLLNPARPSAQLIGVPRPELCPILASVLQSLGIRRGMVVSGKVGDSWLDELSTLDENTVAEFYQDRGFSTSMISPGHFPIQPAALADLAGGNREANAEIVRRLLRNEDRGPKRDAVLLNAAAALFVADKTKTMSDGWELAEEILNSGQAKAKLEELAA
ncbi:MAG TPA: anthranilate phosphoribosyltransferase [Verrucomicrobiae bacterium]|nr:anthranilate phosphoribosyltransferase [Verrucomicrobiae bacterium]